MWLRFFKRLKSKILPIALACVFLVPCFCVTAFAAEAPPDGYVAVSPGEVFSINYASQKHVFPAYAGVEYTITGVSGEHVNLYGVTESGQAVALDVSFSDTGPLVYVADGTYPWIWVEAYVANVVDVSVTWYIPVTLPDVIGASFPFVTGMLAAGTSLVAWLLQTPLALLGVILFVLVFFVVGIRKLIPGT